MLSLIRSKVKNFKSITESEYLEILDSDVDYVGTHYQRTVNLCKGAKTKVNGVASITYRTIGNICMICLIYFFPNGTTNEIYLVGNIS